MSDKNERGEMRAVLGSGRLSRLKSRAASLEISEQELLRRMLDTYLPPEEQQIATQEPPISHQLATEGGKGGGLVASAVASASSLPGRVGGVLEVPPGTSLPTQQSLTTVDTPPVQRPSQGGDPDEDWDHCPDGEDHSLDAEGNCVRCGERVLGLGELTPENFARFQRVEATRFQPDKPDADVIRPVAVPDRSESPQPATKQRGSRPTIGPRFEAFYAAYPGGRKHRKAAEDAFQKLERQRLLPPVDPVAGDLLVASVEWSKRHDSDWLKGYVCAPEVWLNQTRYTETMEALGWIPKREVNKQGWTWERRANGAAIPGQSTPTPRKFSDHIEARGGVGQRLYDHLRDRYAGYPIRPKWASPDEEAECLRLEALWSTFEDSKDYDEIARLRSLIEAELEEIEHEPKSHPLAGAAPGPSQPSLWRDAPS